jgi:hypothetical protein
MFEKQQYFYSTEKRILKNYVRLVKESVGTLEKIENLFNYIISMY